MHANLSHGQSARKEHSEASNSFLGVEELIREEEEQAWLAFFPALLHKNTLKDEFTMSSYYLDRGAKAILEE